MGRTSNKGWSSECNNITTFEVALFVVKPLNHFDKHPFVLRHIVGAIRTCLLNLSSTSQKIKVSMLLLISFDGWNVGMVLGSLTADIILFI